MISKAHSGRGFKGSVSYITNPAKAERVDVRNLASAETAAKEMRAIANRSEAEKPVYHFSIAWAPGENPTQEQMIEAADRMSDRLGLDKSQRVYAIHNDTAHRHIHIVANRVDPETGRAVRMSHDYAVREQVCREIEREQGWQRVKGRHGEKAQEQERPAAKVPDAEHQRERRDGREPFAELVKQRAGDDFKQARSWDDLTRRLDEKGLRVEPWRQGLVITDGTERTKASAIGRDCSLSALERRYGEKFTDYAKRTDRQQAPAEPGKVKDGPFREAQPRGPNDSRERLYQDFRRETAQQIRSMKLARGRAWEKEGKTRSEEKAEIRVAQSYRRQAIYRVTGRGLLRKGLVLADKWRCRREWNRKHTEQRKRWDEEKAKHAQKPPTWLEYVKANAPYDPRAAEELKRLQRRQEREPPHRDATETPGAVPSQPQRRQAKKLGMLDRLAAVLRRPERDGGEDGQHPEKSISQKVREEQRRADRRRDRPDHSDQKQGEGERSRLKDRDQAREMSPEDFKKLSPQEQRQVIDRQAQHLDGRQHDQGKAQQQEHPQQPRTRERDGHER